MLPSRKTLHTLLLSPLDCLSQENPWAKVQYRHRIISFPDQVLHGNETRYRITPYILYRVPTIYDYTHFSHHAVVLSKRMIFHKYPRYDFV